MRFTISKHSMDAALSKIVSFLPSRDHPTQPVMLSLEDGGVYLSTSIPEASVETFAEPVTDLQLPNGEEKSSFAINAKLLLDVVKRANSDAITFDYSAETNVLRIAANTSVWTLPLTHYTNAHPAPTTEHTQSTAATLVTALKAVQYAVGEETGRPYLMMLDVKEGRFRATDGTRYHEVNTGNDKLNFSIFCTVVAPVIAFLNSYGGADVSIGECDEYTHFTIGDDSLAVSKLTVAFPNFDDVWLTPLRTQTPQILRVNRVALLSALERVQLVADKEKPHVEISMDRQSITLTCSRKNGAQASTTIDASWAGAIRSTTFNIKALLKTIKLSQDEDLEIRFTRETRERKSPMIIEEEGSWCLLNQIRTQ